jgi:CRISPR-associated protein (TIGR03986 family)
MMTVQAPFNFVTLSGWVYTPDWADRISHDIPFSDGVSGEFGITITAHSKILAGGERKTQNGIQTVEPFQLPGGTYAIPERSLRGMIRNVLEIAAFGRMKFADDKRFGIRDLTDAAKPYYRDRIVGKVKAGWLWFDGGNLDGREPCWRIAPCDFARVTFADLNAIKAQKQINVDIKWSGRATAESRYNAWGPNKTRQVLNIDGRFARLSPAETGGVQGTLVFTGNTGAGNPGKKAEFFFYNVEGDSESLRIDAKVFGAFKDIHDPDDGRPVNPTWRYWEGRWKSDRKIRIPVFYILDEDGKCIESFGLAMMFKLAHANSVHQMIERTSAAHLESAELDLAATIFGEAADEGENSEKKKGPQGLKSRVHMGLARCTGYKGDDCTWCNGQPQPLNEEATVLAGPKPSYFPMYVRQPVEPGKPGQLKGQTYATYTPIGSRTELNLPEIRGWKRYPAGRNDRIVTPPQGISDKVKVLLKPLPSTTRFVSTVRFHNLRPVEFGALLWALEWGDRKTHCHRLGMGKPYGYGQISIQVDQANWSLQPNRTGQPVQSKEKYVKAFIDEMEREYTGAAKKAGLANCSWEKSEQVLQLLAMADPQMGKQKQLTYMRLETKGVNEFSNAKRNHEVLPEYIELAPSHGQCRDHKIWPRQKAKDNSGSVQPQSHANDKRNFRVGDLVTDTECEECAKIVEISGTVAEIEYLHDGTREKDVPFARLKR